MTRHTRSITLTIPLVLLLSAAAVFLYSAVILFGWFGWEGNWQGWRTIGFFLIALGLLPLWTRDP